MAETAPVEWSDNGPAQEFYFNAYKEAGFQCVRIPITWDTHTLDIAPFTVDTVWLKRVNEIVNWALERDLYVIINAHHDDWLKKNYSNLVFQARFDSIWSQVSTYFKDKPESLLFEILNEPNGLTLAQVDELNERVLKIIRKTNPTRIVFFTGKGWANVDDLIAAKIPADDYIMGYYHSYEPWSFAGQGQGTWGTASDIAAMAARIEKGKVWSETNNIPLVISEFGTDTLCDYNSRMLFLAHYVEEADKRNIAFAVWDDGGTFQVYRRKQKNWHETKELLLNYSSLCPNLFTVSSVDYNINLAWNNRLTNADSIHIERKIDGPEFSLHASLPSSSTSYTDNNLNPEFFYHYRVKMFRNDSVFYSYPQRLFLKPLASERIPFKGEAFAIPGSFQAEDFDKGGYWLTYYDKDFVRTNPTLYRTEKGADIELVADDIIALANNQAGEWYEYSINVAKTANYEIVLYIGSNSDKGLVTTTISEKDRSVYVKATGGIDKTQAFSMFREITAGEHILKLYIVRTGDFVIDSIAIKEDLTIGCDEIDSENNYQLLNYDQKGEIEIISNSSNIIADVAVFNSLGIVVYEQKRAEFPAIINTQELSSGMYFISIKSDKHKSFEIIRYLKD
ncbi:MAG: cellulase family glycosylhydrolase [Bacteroidales bacterium]|nr:cellulase family glycosylhydrolase [Bacteroidales bacterium]